MPALDQVDAMEAGEAGPSSRRGSDPEPVTDALMVSGAGEFGGAQRRLDPRRATRRSRSGTTAAPSRADPQQRVDATDAMARHLARDGTAVDEIDDNDSGFGDSPGHTREPSPERCALVRGADGSFSGAVAVERRRLERGSVAAAAPVRRGPSAAAEEGRSRRR